MFHTKCTRSAGIRFTASHARADTLVLEQGGRVVSAVDDDRASHGARTAKGTFGRQQWLVVRSRSHGMRLALWGKVA